MPDPEWTPLIDRLKQNGIPFEAELTDAEVVDVEGRFSFRFPPDLRAFLQTALPVGEGFPNWRSEADSSLRERLELPPEGILFDVEYNGFWLSEWGPRPEGIDDAKAAARRLVAAAPVLIPIYIHRMIPDRPHQPGNPVFSVHQTDIIYFGADLRDYLIREFLREDDGEWTIPVPIRQIEFWDIERFQETRWSEDGSAIFDNRRGLLPDMMVEGPRWRGFIGSRGG